MQDFIASLLGAIVGASAAIGAAWIAYRGALTTESRKAERAAISDLMSTAFEWDAALLALQEGVQRQFVNDNLIALDEDVRTTGRNLERLSYLVADQETRTLARTLARTGWGARVSIKPPSSMADFGAIRTARDELAARANKVIAGL